MAVASDKDWSVTPNPAEDPEKLALEKKLKRLEAENLKLQKQLELRIIVQKMLTEDLEDKKKEE